MGTWHPPSSSAMNLRSARTAVGRATGFDNQCARASLVGAQIEFADNRFREALRQLDRVRVLDPELAQETLTLYRSASEELGEPGRFRTYLEACLEEAEGIAAHRPAFNRVGKNRSRG